MQIHPYYNRRLNYQRASKPQGQPASDWIQDMLREKDECNFPNQDPDEAFVHRILSGLNDQALSKELMKRRELSVSELIAQVGLWEANKKCLHTTYSSKSTGASANVVTTKKAKGSQGNSKTSKGNATPAQTKTTDKTNPPTQVSKKSDFQCYRCGLRDKDHNCKAKDATCRTCNKVGHYAGMCKSKLRAKVNAAEASTNATTAQ